MSINQIAMTDTITSSAGPQVFPPMRWSLVLAAREGVGGESAAALETICQTYWYPLYAFARRSGQSPPDAQDITQGFFQLFLEKQWVKDVDREKGRLRSFLITALNGFMAKEWRRISSQKRRASVSRSKPTTMSSAYRTMTMLPVASRRLQRSAQRSKT